MHSPAFACKVIDSTVIAFGASLPKVVEGLAVDLEEVVALRKSPSFE